MCDALGLVSAVGKACATRVSLEVNIEATDGSDSEYQQGGKVGRCDPRLFLPHNVQIAI